MKGKILALDFGLKRTGVAITDENKIIASGLTTIDSRELITFLNNLFKREKIEQIIIGLPKRLNNEDSQITSNVHLLKEALQKEFPLIPIELYDERFTSKMAFQTMIDSGLSKKQRQKKELIDEISATILLQSFLQSIQ